MASRNPTIRIRVNQIDYTLQPSGALDNTTLPRVPVIRIYGESSVGIKACVHVHQVFPYFFLEYTGKMSPEHVNRHIARLSISLNHAIAVSLRRNPSSPNAQFVRAIILVKGVHFYGFHSSYSPFLKVLLSDPAIVNRAVTLLQAGTIMKTRFRIYESHLSYILQFMSDFGLYGCGWIDLAETWQRDCQDPASEEHLNSSQTLVLPLDVSFRPSSYYRQTRMPLELDVVSHQILNRHLLSARNVHDKLIIPAPPLPDEPVVLGVRELWEDERRRRAARGLPPTPVLPPDPSARSRGKGGEWAAEARWWDEIRKKIERERTQESEPPSSQSWERWVMSTFESVEALWEPRWKVWKPVNYEAAQETIAQPEVGNNPYEAAAGSSQESNPQESESDVDIDECMLTSHEMSRIVEQEELEWEQREQGQPETNNDDGAAEEIPLPEPELEPQEDETTPKQTPSKSPSKVALREAYQRALKKLVGMPSSEASGIEDVTPTQSPRPSSEFKTPTKDTYAAEDTPKATKRRFDDVDAAKPILDASENPFLDPRPSETSKLRGLFAEDIAAHTPSIILETDESEHLPSGGGVNLSRAPQFSQDRSTSPVIQSIPRIDVSEDDDAPIERAAKRRKLNESNIVAVEHSLASSISLPSPLNTASFPRLSARATQETAAYQYALPPPSTAELLSSVNYYGVPSKVYQNPYYSIESDAPERPREYAGLVFHLKGGTGVSVLEDFQSGVASETSPSGHVLSSVGVHGWEYASLPPSVKEVRKWLAEHQDDSNVAKPKKSSQIIGPTQVNPYGLQSSETSAPVSAREHGNMTALSVEVFAPSRNEHLPDPGTDEVAAIFWAFYDANLQRDDHDQPFTCDCGVIAVHNSYLEAGKLRDWNIDIADTELDVINRLIDIVNELDPDIVTGWEVQVASWGYLSARASTYGLDFGEQISRAPARQASTGTDQWGLRTTSTFKVIGRHVINLWRIMRSEQSLLNYTFENAVFNTLRRRTPRYNPSTLTEWYHSDVPGRVSRLFQYHRDRTSMVLEMIEVAEVVTKISEFARVFGVDFYSVISRGSQFKVESFMARIAKPESFLLLSPSKQDVGKQNAAECMPLIMEPISAFYTSPLLVLDFQSLYPSVMIAYNYCYSTCLGRAVDFKGQNKFGVTELQYPPGVLESLKDYLIVSPNGMLFVKPEVRKGLLGRMLTELLDTRVMVKQAMKNVNDKALKRVLDARQLSLKFIANVTYGYTSASFSGRMPAVEVADAIVQTGRETLEKAIRVIDGTPKWGAKVVYGDTDSVFIYLRGRTKEQAFRIGNEISETITKMNPAPIKLKFEKVYLPCVLMAKKRYVGFKYENPDDTEPVFDAKGIETVRRDGVPAQQKMVETTLKLLFRTQDLSKIKDYCCTTWAQILEHKVSIQDFTFAKEVRMGTYSDKGPPPPGVAVAARRMAEDPNDEPQYGDRVPYVVARGEPGTRLVDRAVRPEDVLNDPHKHLDAQYYITRVLIPPLARILSLVGADVRAWYDEMPKGLYADAPGAESVLMSPRKASRAAALVRRYKIDAHFFSEHCVACGAIGTDIVCDACRMQPVEAIAALSAKLNRTETRLSNVQRVCASCTRAPVTEPVGCESLDCPWLYERKKSENRAEGLQLVRDLIEDLEEDIEEAQTARELAETGIDLNDAVDYGEDAEIQEKGELDEEQEEEVDDLSGEEMEYADDDEAEHLEPDDA